MPADELAPLRTAQKWTRYMDVRMCITIALILLSWFSGIFSWWGHFDGCGLWLISYPQNDGSSKLLNIMRVLFIGQLACAAAESYIWLFKMIKWRHGVCERMGEASRMFGIFVICDVHRVLCELASLILFYRFYVEAVAERPSDRVLLSWIVDLMAERVVGFVPLFAWLLPMVLSATGLLTVSCVWEEFCRQQSFNRRFSMYKFDKIVGVEDEENGGG